MYKDGLRNSLNPKNIYDTVKYEIDELRAHPNYMRVFGTCVFCGAQGEGKTLSAVQYVTKLSNYFPCAIIVSNVAIKDRPFNAFLDGQNNIRYIETKELINTEYILSHVRDKDFRPITIEYTGLEQLKYVNNAEYGVIFLIDEIHLELNSLESKNVDIEVMVEISQQRKQRKHIVGTSQVFMRMAKPLREQIHDIILCKKYLGLIQFNKWIKGDTVVEKNGKIEADVQGRFLWFHSPKYYQQYDTYAKMKRYNEEWNGRKRIDGLYENGGTPIYDKNKRRVS